MSDRNPTQNPIPENGLPITRVWHEVGHVFAYELIQVLGNKTYKVVDFNLISDCENSLRVISDDTIYKHRENETAMDYQHRLLKRLRKRDDLCLQLILNALGPIVQLSAMHPEPAEAEFKTLFSNIEGEGKDGELEAQGYDDFEKIKELVAGSPFSMLDELLRGFCMEVFAILKKHHLFKHLEPIVTACSSQFNGKQLQDSENGVLQDERNRMAKLIHDPIKLDFFRLIGPFKRTFKRDVSL
jgi:hypothetical protein